MHYPECVWDFGGTSDRLMQLRHVVRRETVRLVTLTLIAAVVFLATRLVAQRFEHVELEDAAAWYDRGHERLAAGDAEQAAVAFRRAVMKHRGEKRYVLALADALARAGRPDAAERAVQGIREFAPEDPEVNLALAQLALVRDDTATAVRFYHHAIYAPDSTPERARHIRLGLVRMLLDSGDDTRANSELIAATIDLPDGADARLEVAELFERASNDERAAEQYQRVLEAEPKHPAALQGAVRTAFALGDYRQVLRYRLPDDAPAEIQELSQVAREVVARDPLAPRLAAAERRRRLLQNIAHLEQRWRDCGLAATDATPPGYPAALVELRRAARPAAIGRDSEGLEAALGTIDRLRADIVQRCTMSTAIDRALDIIARRYGGTAP